MEGMSAERRVPAIKLGATATSMRSLKKKRARRQIGDVDVFTARKPLSEKVLQVRKAVVLLQEPAWGRQQILL